MNPFRLHNDKLVLSKSTVKKIFRWKDVRDLTDTEAKLIAIKAFLIYIFGVYFYTAQVHLTTRGGAIITFRAV